MAARTELLNAARNYWNYVDIIALGIAGARANRLTAGFLQWCQVIYGFQQSIQTRTPELLRHVSFEHRPPLPPLSDEVEGALSVLRMGGLLRTTNPFGQVYEMAPGAKRRLQEEPNPSLQPYLGVIAELSEMIDRNLPFH